MKGIRAVSGVWAKKGGGGVEGSSSASHAAVTVLVQQIVSVSFGGVDGWLLEELNWLTGRVSLLAQLAQPFAKTAIQVLSGLYLIITETNLCRHAKTAKVDTQTLYLGEFA